jgi:hypothetical protein
VTVYSAGAVYTCIEQNDGKALKLRDSEWAVSACLYNTLASTNNLDGQEQAREFRLVSSDLATDVSSSCLTSGLTTK